MKEMSKTTETSKILLSKPVTYSKLAIPINPPRPPCWQDFRKSVSSDSRAYSLSISSTDTAGCRKAKSSCSSMRKKHNKSSSVSVTAGGQQSSPSNASGLKHTTLDSNKASINICYKQGKLKRTRSESCICKQEIPHLTLTSHESARKSDSVEEATRRYLQDTYLKCSKWLSQISAPCSDGNSNICGTPVDNSLGTSYDNLSAFEDEFSSMDVSTEDDILGERKRYSLDRIPE